LQLAGVLQQVQQSSKQAVKLFKNGDKSEYRYKHRKGIA
jgi:hypothetical protein